MSPHLELDGVKVCAALASNRLCRLFRLAWRRLPEEARRDIVRHWLDPDHHGIFSRPVVALTERPVDGVAVAVTSMRGFLLRFHALVLVEWDEERIEDLIAHQLAHVHDYAVDGTDLSQYLWSDESLATAERASAAMEEYAMETMRDWGFDPVQDAAWPTK